MTAAKIMDVIARLPGCDGQAADAVSPYTQVKMEDAPRLLRIPKSQSPDVWNLSNLVKIWHEITELQHTMDPRQMEPLREAVRRVKEETSAVLLRWVYSLECYCYLRNVRDFLAYGKTHD